MIFVLFLAIATSGEPYKNQQQMPSMESCWKAAQEIMEAATPEMVRKGISVGCYQRQAGEPS